MYGYWLEGLLVSSFAKSYFIEPFSTNAVLGIHKLFVTRMPNQIIISVFSSIYVVNCWFLISFNFIGFNMIYAEFFWSCCWWWLIWMVWLNLYLLFIAKQLLNAFLDCSASISLHLLRVWCPNCYHFLLRM